MTTFEGLGEHNLNRKAIDIIFKALPSDALRVSDILGQATPFDIVWNKRRLCIRAARESLSSRFPKWNYTIGGVKAEKVDFYILIAIRNEEIYKIFVLPPSVIPQTTITVSEHGDFIRYQMFEADLNELGSKIEAIAQELPKLEKLYKEAKIK